MLCFLLAALGTALAAPSEVNFQGRIADVDGGAVNGVHELTFGLFAAETGGSPEWSDSVDLTLSDGIFAVHLGSTSGNPLDLNALSNSAWIETRIDGGAPIGGRQPLSAVPFARMTEALATVAPECDGSATGRLYFDTVTSDVRICDGAEFLRVNACSDSCLPLDEVACGDTATTGCGETCSGVGTGIDQSECTLGSSVECGEPIADSCGNDCGYAGSSSNSAQCDSASSISCGDAVADDCGNDCGYAGDQCPDGLSCNGTECLSCSGACCGLDGGTVGSITVAELNSCLGALGVSSPSIQYIEVAYGHTNYLDTICQEFGYASYASVYGSDQCSSPPVSPRQYPSYCNPGVVSNGCTNGCGNTNYPGFVCNQ
ncbi:MAG: hypothetical protein ACJAV2_004739 [Myxococcota bacterium]|jgi:hypothetical protein